MDNKSIREAVNLWCENKKLAIEKYGEINNWDTSKVTDMNKLFYHKKHFNDNIENWDVSNVTNMAFMFDYAYNFNQPLNNWDVSKVTNMYCMFCGYLSINIFNNSSKNIKTLNNNIYGNTKVKKIYLII